MTYCWKNGKYQNAYTFLFTKLIPKNGSSVYPLGEALRLISKVYYRYYNDGDNYEDCIEMGIISYPFCKPQFPFDNEYKELGDILDIELDSGKYEEAINIVLRHIMINLSNKYKIYNPDTNRLVSLTTKTGIHALKRLEMTYVSCKDNEKSHTWHIETIKPLSAMYISIDSPGIPYNLNTNARNNITKQIIEFNTDTTILGEKINRIRILHNNTKKKQYNKNVYNRKSLYYSVDLKRTLI